MNLTKGDCQGYRASCLAPQIIGNPVKGLALLPKASSPRLTQTLKTLSFPLKTSHEFSEL